ncbi:DUF5359 family protein [Rossellomorea sp. BNER]|jgi:Family of unknown function (DUF5359)|uniref:DUF5359 family protein n=1 Tax=Rossellomorea sp. BNER TaxID=2962031 RepID=UPI003AF21CD2|nr:YpfB family protein [Rossellomorea sp. BNER]
MRKIERWIIKLIIIQTLLLIFAQTFFHQLDYLPQWQKVVFYEGVNEMSHSEIVETLNGR